MPKAWPIEPPLISVPENPAANPPHASAAGAAKPPVAMVTTTPMTIAAAALKKLLTFFQNEWPVGSVYFMRLSKT